MSKPRPSRECSFVLPPGKQVMFNAGEYDLEAKQPGYHLSMEGFDYAIEQVELSDELIGGKTSCFQIYKLHNKSNFFVWVTVKRDGKILPGPAHI